MTVPEQVAQLAYDDPTRPGNPRKVEIPDLKKIFANAVEGRL